MGTGSIALTRRSGPATADGAAATVVDEASFLGGLPRPVRSALIAAAHGVIHRRGERLLGASDDAITVHLTGVALARTPTVEGDHTIHAIRAAGDVHGLTAVLDNPSAAAELVAVDRVEALVLPGPTVREAVATIPEVTRAALVVVAREHATARVEEATFANRSAAYRVVHRILELAERFGQRDGDRVRVTVALSQEELASWARASRESAAKALHDLRVAGVVTTGRRELVIEDLPALRRRHGDGPDRTVAALLRAIG